MLDSIRRIVQTLRVASRAAERQHGLSAAQLFILQKLADGDAVSINELAERTLTHQSSVSVVVQRLAKSQLVSRGVSRSDGRQITISLTSKGRSLLDKSPRAAQEKLIDAVNGLPNSQRTQLAELLQLVADQTSATAVHPAMFFEESTHHAARGR